MDPNANLAEQERLFANVNASAGISALDADDRYRLRELRAALTGWIRTGGVEPDWTLAPRAAEYFGH